VTVVVAVVVIRLRRRRRNDETPPSEKSIEQEVTVATSTAPDNGAHERKTTQEAEDTFVVDMSDGPQTKDAPQLWRQQSPPEHVPEAEDSATAAVEDIGLEEMHASIRGRDGSRLLSAQFSESMDEPRRFEPSTEPPGLAQNASRLLSAQFSESMEEPSRGQFGGRIPPRTESGEFQTNMEEPGRAMGLARAGRESDHQNDFGEYAYRGSVESILQSQHLNFRMQSPEPTESMQTQNNPLRRERAETEMTRLNFSMHSFDEDLALPEPSDGEDPDATARASLLTVVQVKASL
jgi:hypothetical protein